MTRIFSMAAAVCTLLECMLAPPSATVAGTRGSYARYGSMQPRGATL
jgi:hypothetical protein